MKEKIKISVLSISIFYMIIIIILSLNSYIRSSEKVDLDVMDGFNETLSLYKEEANTITDNNCKEYLINLINYIKKINNNKNTSITDYYNKVVLNEEYQTYLSNYLLLGSDERKCLKISADKAKEYQIPFMYLVALEMNDKIMNYYGYQYEIGIKDIYFRYITSFDFIINSNYTKQTVELNIIKGILEIIKEEEVVENENL